jgi:hypothetical protein
LGLAQFYSTGPNPPGQPAHQPFSPARVRLGVVPTAPLSVPTAPAAAAPRATSPHDLHAQAMPLLHVRRFTPSLSPAFSSVRSKDCSNRQHHCHLARSRSAADVVPLLPTVGRRRREMPRRASSHQSSCPSVFLHEPSRGAPPRSAAMSGRLLLLSSGTPPQAGHSGPPPVSPSPPRALRRPCKLRPRPLLWPLTGEPPPPDCAAMGSATSVSPSPPRHIKSGPHLVVVFPDPLAHRLSPPAIRIDDAAAARATWLPCSRQWAANPWAAGQPIGPGQIWPRSTVAFTISYLNSINSIKISNHF